MGSKILMKLVPLSKESHGCCGSLSINLPTVPHSKSVLEVAEATVETGVFLSPSLSHLPPK